MEITLQNLGALEYANFSLGDLTIICGKNNTGKTYAAYSLFGFLEYWRTNKIRLPIEEEIEKLLQTGKCEIDLSADKFNIQKILLACSKQYTKNLSTTFSCKKEFFSASSFEINFEKKMNLDTHSDYMLVSNKCPLINLSKRSPNLLQLNIFQKDNDIICSSLDIIENVSSYIISMLYGKLFPNCFILSTERTGITTFLKELDFARNKLLEELSENPDEKKILFFNVKKDYSSAINFNIEFVRNIKSVVNLTSFLSKEHQDILEYFDEIANGKYEVNEIGERYFVPSKPKKTLSMHQSSSSVRALSDLGFYLRHMAQKGDLLIIDEPELNLHPENQRKIARLFAQLVNIGIKVFITTHSDYIIRELNTLIMLNSDKPHIKKIQKEEKYSSSELLDFSKVKVYVAEQGKIPAKSRKGNTLIKAPIDEQGIEVKSFDDTIEKINQIQEAIVWGE